MRPTNRPARNLLPGSSFRECEAAVGRILLPEGEAARPLRPFKSCSGSGVRGQVVAVPAVKGVGIYAKKPMCGVMLGLDDRDPNDLEVLFNRDGRNTGACEYAPGQGGMGGGPNGDGYYFR